MRRSERRVVLPRLRQADARLELAHVRAAGLRVCCGGIVGTGESRKDRAGLLVQLANLPEHPESVPINNLVRVAGTPMQDAEVLSPLELARCIAVARTLMPRAVVRPAAGRTTLSEAAQALCFMAGAGSIFCGEQVLTMPNPSFGADTEMFRNLGLAAQTGLVVLLAGAPGDRQTGCESVAFPAAVPPPRLRGLAECRLPSRNGRWQPAVAKLPAALSPRWISRCNHPTTVSSAPDRTPCRPSRGPLPIPRPAQARDGPCLGLDAVLGVEPLLQVRERPARIEPEPDLS